jgi:hypothetical protein
MFYDNMIMIVENAGRLTTSGSARTYVVGAPLATTAWNAPGHRLSEQGVTALSGNGVPSVTSAPSPRLKASFTHQASGGIDHEIAGELAVAVNVVYARGFNLPGTLDYNPLLPSRLGPGRRPNDAPCAGASVPGCVNGGVAGSSTSVLQFTGFGETWYKGLTFELKNRLRHGVQFVASYTLSKAEDSSTDFQTAFLPQNNGYGRNPADRAGLPLGFEPLSERGRSTQDQRHRFVFSGSSQLPWKVQLAGIVSAVSGRPFTPLAGADLNGDGNGGQFPSDRARRDPADELTSVRRNSATTVGQTNVDIRVSRSFRVGGWGSIEAIVEAFNVFNRTNFIEDTNQSSFVVFGSGAYPSNPLPAYGRYTLAMPPRQVQLAVRLSF